MKVDEKCEYIDIHVYTQYDPTDPGPRGWNIVTTVTKVSATCLDSVKMSTSKDVSLSIGSI